MAQVLLQIGTNSTSLNTLPNSPSEEIGIERQKLVKNLQNFHGSRIINIVGNNKKVITLTFQEIKDVNYVTFASYADVVKKWWIRVTGRTGVNILNAFCYVEFSNITINRVADDAIVYDFELKIYEI